MPSTVNDNPASPPADFLAIGGEKLRAANASRRRRLGFIIGVGLYAMTAISLVTCSDSAFERRPVAAGTASDSPYVIALGNLEQGETPTDAEIRLSEFLFGTTPETPLGLVKPVALAASGDELLICDSALNGVFRYRAGQLTALQLNPSPQKPVGIDIPTDGTIAIADAGAAAVMIYGSDGAVRSKLTVDGAAFRPADAAFVGREIWVTNAAESVVEVFDPATGRHVRSIGRRGNARGEFGVPLGMAAADGGAFVVDMLNVRVQRLGSDGSWKQTIGRGGDRVGSFGRPKDVAVGPDGTIFVVDTSSQRVHAFAPDGRALLAFGAPGSGRGALSMPAGVCIAPSTMIKADRLPKDVQPDYLVAVAEQLDTPGIRLFAWCATAAAKASAAESPRSAVRRIALSDVPNPHWDATRCDDCHAMSGDIAQPIEIKDVDTTCLSCHDGRRASAEPHPVGRIANHADIKTPAAWPTNDGRVSCITCHDIRKHCSTSAARPAVNPMLLRFHEPEKPLAFCTQCHQVSDAWRLSPHDQVASDGTIRTQTCAFCHSSTPAIPADGARRGNAMLREASSDVCLTCHTKHWDYSPEGHVERMTTESVRSRMQMVIAGGSSGAALLPLVNQRVTCYTCHNPHDAKLFPPSSPLGSLASAPADAAISLRRNRTELCLSCHLE